MFAGKKTVSLSIMLNEACSAGCGSLYCVFADSENGRSRICAGGNQVHMPVDLGSRCTVFMNSRVSGHKKEGDHRRRGCRLSYSVIKNALFKVIKPRDFNEIGDHCIVQGRHLYISATLRALSCLPDATSFVRTLPAGMGTARRFARDRAGSHGSLNAFG